MNPFKKHDVTDFDVFVPLENSQRQLSPVEPRGEKESSDIETPTSRAIRKGDIDAQLGSQLSPQTVNGLRAEIDHGTQDQITLVSNFGD